MHVGLFADSVGTASNGINISYRAENVSCIQPGKKAK